MVTQALGSLGPSFPPQPDLKLGLGKCESQGNTSWHSFSRKAEEAESVEESRLAFPSVSVPFGRESRLRLLYSASSLLLLLFTTLPARSDHFCLLPS